jgi:lipopolysaccharide/colanic/teichoic acid biosynthesis glycosyltransferase
LQHPAVGRRRFDVVGVLSVDVETDSSSRGTARLAEMLQLQGADTILVAGSIGVRTMRQIADLALLHHCDLLAVMPTEVLADHDPVVIWSGDSPFVQLVRVPRQAWELRAKRAIDVVLSFAGLVLAAPLFLLLAIAIRLESPGAALFRHERVGLRGRRFLCLKLRTMRADAEDTLRADAAMYDEYRRNHFKILDDRDPRVTRLGKLLRRTSIDELPQLWNVLVGEMSLVGPRPVVEDELAMYESSRDLLLSVKPGITGNWGVSGRHSVGYPERCDVELRYVREWSLKYDFQILAATAGAVIRPGGAD